MKLEYVAPTQEEGKEAYRKYLIEYELGLWREAGEKPLSYKKFSTYYNFRHKKTFINKQIQTTCPVCGSNESETVTFHAGSPSYPASMSYIHCQQCGVMRKCV